MNESNHLNNNAKDVKENEKVYSPQQQAENNFAGGNQIKYSLEKTVDCYGNPVQKVIGYNPEDGSTAQWMGEIDLPTDGDRIKSENSKKQSDKQKKIILSAAFVLVLVISFAASSMAMGLPIIPRKTANRGSEKAEKSIVPTQLLNFNDSYAQTPVQNNEKENQEKKDDNESDEKIEVPDQKEEKPDIEEKDEDLEYKKEQAQSIVDDIISDIEEADKKEEAAQNSNNSVKDSYRPVFFSWEKTGYDAQDIDYSTFRAGMWLTEDEKGVLYIDYPDSPDYMTYDFFYQDGGYSGYASVMESNAPEAAWDDSVGIELYYNPNKNTVIIYTPDYSEIIFYLSKAKY